MNAGRIAAALAKIEHAQRMLDEGVRDLAAATSVVPGDVAPRTIRRPPGESDEVAAARARRILREKGFVPR